MHGGSFDPSPHPLNQCAIRHSAGMQPQCSMLTGMVQQHKSRGAKRPEQSHGSSGDAVNKAAATNSSIHFIQPTHLEGGVKLWVLVHAGLEARREGPAEQPPEMQEAEFPKVMRGGPGMCGHAQCMPSLSCHSVLSSTAAGQQAWPAGMANPAARLPTCAPAPATSSHTGTPLASP